jgi:hypothetical protein
MSLFKQTALGCTAHPVHRDTHGQQQQSSVVVIRVLIEDAPLGFLHTTFLTCLSIYSSSTALMGLPALFMCSHKTHLWAQAHLSRLRSRLWVSGSAGLLPLSSMPGSQVLEIPIQVTYILSHTV